MSFNKSVDSIKQKDTDYETRHKDDFIQELTMRTSEIQHKRYGEMVVLLETDRVLITLGPDYICFIATFITFAVSGIFLTSFVNAAFQRLWVKALNVTMVITQQLSYLLVGLSNPGVALQQNLASEQTVEQETQQIKRFCKKCQIKMLKNMHHCKRCDVCIREYDHHCPWISKCIGASNLKRFYFFVSFTPFYIIYFMIMTLVSTAVNYSNQYQKP